MPRRSSYRFIRIRQTAIPSFARGKRKVRHSECLGKLSQGDAKPNLANRNVPKTDLRKEPKMSTLTVADPGRRDFLFLATGAMAAAGAAAVAWPLVDQMNPDASTAAGATIEVDLAPIAQGQIVIVKYRGGPAVHPAANGQGDRRRRRHQSRRTQGSADRRATRPEAGVVDRVGDMHPPGLRPDRPRRSL